MRRTDPLPELEELYREGFARFLRVARAVTGDRESARDAVQEGFFKAIHQRRAFRGRGPLEAWVWRIVLNEARRARRTRVELVPESGYEIVATGNGHSRDEDEQLRVAVAALPERQRLVLFLRYYADLDYAAIGLALGIERGTVSATLHAAHASLRRVLTEVQT